MFSPFIVLYGFFVLNLFALARDPHEDPRLSLFLNFSDIS